MTHRNCDPCAGSAWTGRAYRTSGDAFKDADYGQAIWPHVPHRPSWKTSILWISAVLCIAAAALYLIKN